MYKHFYQSEDLEELKKERVKQQGILSLMPLTAGGAVDETNYVLLDKKVSDNNARVKEAVGAVINEPKNEINPWFIEKNLDEMQTFKLARPISGYRTIKYPRPGYGGDEMFEKINMSKFESVIGHSFDFEGGYTNRKEDRETNYGITRPFMENYKYALPGGKVKPISELTKEDARLLYKAQWDEYNLGYIRDKELALVLNDYMINSNAKNVAKRVQSILNSTGNNLKIDGNIGEQTLEVIHKTNKEWLIEQILIDRLKRYQYTLDREPYKKIYITGWIKRLNELAELTHSNIRFKNTDLKTGE